MAINCIACGIFQFELEKILPEISAELGCAVQIDYTDPGLDTHADTLEHGNRTIALQ